MFIRELKVKNCWFWENVYEEVVSFYVELNGIYYCVVVFENPFLKKVIV